MLLRTNYMYTHTYMRIYIYMPTLLSPPSLQIVSGLLHLHKDLHVVHRDIKPSERGGYLSGMGG